MSFCARRRKNKPFWRFDCHLLSSSSSFTLLPSSIVFPSRAFLLLFFSFRGRITVATEIFFDQNRVDGIIIKKRWRRIFASGHISTWIADHHTVANSGSTVCWTDTCSDVFVVGRVVYFHHTYDVHARHSHTQNLNLAFIFPFLRLSHLFLFPNNEHTYTLCATESESRDCEATDWSKGQRKKQKRSSLQRGCDTWQSQTKLRTTRVPLSNTQKSV